jgi:uncharacterized membrane protein YidH (DUF202 family)
VKRLARDLAPDRVYDAGLQQERTSLSWTRTALAVMAAGAVFLRGGEPPYHSPRHLPGIVAVVLGVALLLHGAQGRYERLHHVLGHGKPVATPWLIRAVGVGVTLFSAAALALVLFGG